jgi:hypothetical protein
MTQGTRAKAVTRKKPESSGYEKTEEASKQARGVQGGHVWVLVQTETYA